MVRIIVAVILVVILLTGIYFWQNKTIPDIIPTISDKTSSAEKYINKKWKFSLEIPGGFFVDETDTFLYIVKEPTLDDETPSPDMRVKIEQGSKTTIDSNDDLKVLSQTNVSINNIPGHKTIVSYGSLPEGNGCPIYRLHNSGTVYELSLYECLESSIFETVVKSFKIIKLSTVP
ncbi:hypothetical protein A2803_01270 [Candidatus Woesebacteria bacterium RIFCSPHIGHO2_01_FULL_44_21]|uniref:Uncharacterized protein n=1 Tax=Candidatus Woesebacteria bacterium RIFCSPHIGHO2_01_FULL_44_21 TaxID=1802503 RepID=A0A1F7YZB4_9BACT|nr:MAG: hypothetical protein A2803_01270 [Candidatus Woesebacteria bacterium RIFCSPHIGHO2_01_FULL_44_21]OGM70822.1 MAG: hypothetical protein A2897_05260 [Candidatus Woesebacteria bacterium RIFCSPLOWO2_01_FULL_44_24b]